MDNFLEPREKRGFAATGLIIGGVAGLLILAGAVLLFWKFGGVKGGNEEALKGAIVEGTPEFDAYTKQIIISTDPNRLLQSKTGLGTITMGIGGSVYNKGDRTLSALEVMVGVIDPQNRVIKEKKFLLLPSMRRETLGPGESMNVGVELGGFNENDDRANVRWRVTAFKFQ